MTISNDLAIVGRTSRARAGDLDATLRTIGAQPIPMSPVDAFFVSASRIYAARVARIATGIAIVVLFAARMVDVLIPNVVSGHRTDVAYDLLWRHLDLLNTVAAFALVYGIASIAAERTFRLRVVEAPDPHVLAKASLAAVDRWSLAATIAGGATFVGLQFVVLVGMNNADLLWLQSDGSPQWTEPDVLVVGIPLVIALLATWAGAVIVARRHGDRVVPFRFAVVALAIASIIGRAMGTPQFPSIAMGIVFGGAMLCVTVAISILAVGRRVGENAVISQEAV